MAGRQADGGLAERVFQHPESDHTRELIDAIPGSTTPVRDDAPPPARGGADDDSEAAEAPGLLHAPARSGGPRRALPAGDRADHPRRTRWLRFGLGRPAPFP